MKKTILSLILASTLAMPAFAQTTEAQRVPVFTRNFEGSKYYRIPAVVTMPDGTIVAVADKRWNNNGDLPNHIDVVCRRSTDGGHTWSETSLVAGKDTETGYGDPALVLDRNTGDLICIFTWGNGLWQSTPNDHARICTSRSHDGGKTWSEPADISWDFYGSHYTGEERKHWLTAFASSGRAEQLKSGRLMFVLVVRIDPKVDQNLHLYSVYSDDGGYSWNLSKNAADTNGDESKVAELSNGDVLMSIRNRWRGDHKFSISHDGGETWSEPWFCPEIQEPGCNGDLMGIEYKGQHVLLLTVPNDPAKRKNVTVFASFDDGKTWQKKRTICATGSAYSSITQLKDGSIGALIEEDAPEGGYNLNFSSFPIDWLLGE